MDLVDYAFDWGPYVTKRPAKICENWNIPLQKYKYNVMPECMVSYMTAGYMHVNYAF
jgi:hypothetical protein